MKRQAFQRGEIRDENDNIISEGAYSKKTAFATKTNDGILDYIINNFQALFDMISGACVYVDELPTSGDSDKLYIVNSTGKTYRWDGKQFVFVTEAVNGLSAYEIAKQNGFTGTEAQWLESIRGEKGESITDATVDSNGYLILTLSTGTIIKTALQPIVETKQYADNAAASASQAKESAANAASSASQANASDAQASASASDAASSAAKAKQSETNAANSESNARQYKNAANDSKTAASTSASNASKSEVNAKASMNSAANSATSANTSANNAKTSETHAAASETNAKQALVESQKIQKEVEAALSKVTGFAKYAGSVDNYVDLPASGNNTGDVWNIVNADAAHQIKAGDNVIWNGSSWDNLSGFVDLSNYPTNTDVAKAVVDTTYSGGTITFIHKDGTKSTATIGDTSHATQADQDGEGNIITDTYYKKSDASTIHQSFQNQINTKQDKLTVDTAPTADSKNLVTSGGIKTALDGKLSLTGGTVTGNVTVSTLKTGTDASNYFQCMKFRGEGDANTYYHAIDFGCSTHEQVDFHEYSGIWNFYKNRTGKADGGSLVGSIQPDGWHGNVIGNVTGNASSATKAAQDASGNIITSTYATKASVPIKTSQLTNDSGFATKNYVDTSGTTIVKNIPGYPLAGTDTGGSAYLIFMLDSNVGVNTVASVIGPYVKNEINSAVSGGSIDLSDYAKKTDVPAVTVSGNTIAFGNVKIGVD